MLLPREAAVSLQVALKFARTAHRVRCRLFQQFLFKWTFEMFGDYGFDVSDSIAGELEYVHLILRKSILQRMEFAQAKIFFKRVLCCQDLIEQLSIHGDLPSLDNTLPPL